MLIHGNAAKTFDPVKHLETAPELVNRKFNRPRLDTLRKSQIDFQKNKEALKAMRREREKKAKELDSRLQRDQYLARVERELEIQKALRVS